MSLLEVYSLLGQIGASTADLAPQLAELAERGGQIKVVALSISDAGQVAAANAAVIDGYLRQIELAGARTDGFGSSVVGVAQSVSDLALGVDGLQSKFLQLDPRGREQEIQELTAALQRGSVDIESVVERISQLDQQVGGTIEKLVGDLREGRIRAEDFANYLRDFERSGVAGPGSALAGLLDELGQQGFAGQIAQGRDQGRF